MGGKGSRRDSNLFANEKATKLWGSVISSCKVQESKGHAVSACGFMEVSH